MREVQALRRHRPPPRSRQPPPLGGGGQRRKMAADSEVSLCPAPPAGSLFPDSSPISPCSLRSPPLPLSPRSPSRRCSRSRTSLPPPSGRGRCCRAPHSVTSPARPLLAGTAGSTRSLSRSLSRSLFPAVPR